MMRLMAAVCMLVVAVAAARGLNDAQEPMKYVSGSWTSFGSPVDPDAGGTVDFETGASPPPPVDPLVLCTVSVISQLNVTSSIDPMAGLNLNETIALVNRVGLQFHFPSLKKSFVLGLDRDVAIEDLAWSPVPVVTPNPTPDNPEPSPPPPGPVTGFHNDPLTIKIMEVIDAPSSSLRVLSRDVPVDPSPTPSPTHWFLAADGSVMEHQVTTTTGLTFNLMMCWFGASYANTVISPSFFDSSVTSNSQTIQASLNVFLDDAFKALHALQPNKEPALRVPSRELLFASVGLHTNQKAVKCKRNHDSLVGYFQLLFDSLNGTVRDPFVDEEGVLHNTTLYDAFSTAQGELGATISFDGTTYWEAVMVMPVGTEDPREMNDPILYGPLLSSAPHGQKLPGLLPRLTISQCDDFPGNVSKRHQVFLFTILAMTGLLLIGMVGMLVSYYKALNHPKSIAREDLFSTNTSLGVYKNVEMRSALKKRKI